MTEKEKMLAGLIYDANYDEELLKERMKAKDLCFEYNYSVKPSEIEKQNEILKKLFGKTKENFTVTTPFWCDYGYNIELGENFYSNHNVVIAAGSVVTIDIPSGVVAAGVPCKVVKKITE